MLKYNRTEHTRECMRESQMAELIKYMQEEEGLRCIGFNGWQLDNEKKHRIFL